MNILGMSNPRDIKVAGDNITTKAVWEEHKERFMRSIVFNKFAQNEDIRKMLIDTGDITLYECTRNRWWGSGYKLDSPEWATTKCPGLNKMGCILMDVRTALRKKVFNTPALTKSPGALIKAMQLQDKQILDDARNSSEVAVDRPVAMEMDLPVIPETGADMETENQDPNFAPPKVDPSEDCSASSTADSDDMMDPTDVEEDSVNISATSSVSTVSAASIANVTGPDGKLDISKIRNWSIPKIDKIDPSLRDSFVGTRTRNQQLRTSLPASFKDQIASPQAQSTPQVARMHQSTLMEKVRSNLTSKDKK